MKALCLYFHMILFVCQNFRKWNWKFGRNMPLATFGSERVKLWSCFSASASRRLTAIIELKRLNFCSRLLYNVYQSCESEYIKFTNLNGFHVLPYWSATKLSFKNKSFSYLKKLETIDEWPQSMSLANPKHNGKCDFKGLQRPLWRFNTILPSILLASA